MFQHLWPTPLLSAVVFAAYTVIVVPVVGTGILALFGRTHLLLGIAALLVLFPAITFLYVAAFLDLDLQLPAVRGTPFSAVDGSLLLAGVGVVVIPLVVSIEWIPDGLLGLWVLLVLLTCYALVPAWLGHRCVDGPAMLAVSVTVVFGPLALLGGIVTVFMLPTSVSWLEFIPGDFFTLFAVGTVLVTYGAVRSPGLDGVDR